MMSNIDDTFDDGDSYPDSMDEGFKGDETCSEDDDTPGDIDGLGITASDFTSRTTKSKSSSRLSNLGELVRAKQDYINGLRSHSTGHAQKYKDSLVRFIDFDFWSDSNGEFIDISRIVKMVEGYEELAEEYRAFVGIRTDDQNIERERYEKALAAYKKQKKYHVDGDLKKKLNDEGKARGKAIVKRNNKKMKAILGVCASDWLASKNEYYSALSEYERNIMVKGVNIFKRRKTGAIQFGDSADIVTALAIETRYRKQRVGDIQLFNEKDGMRMGASLVRAIAKKIINYKELYVTYDELYAAGIEAIKKEGWLEDPFYYVDLVVDSKSKLQFIMEHVLVRLIEREVLAVKVDDSGLSFRMGEKVAPGKQRSYDGWIFGCFIPEEKKTFKDLGFMYKSRNRG
jgi:hypothetical protein